MPPDAKLSKEEIAAFLSTTPEALAEFETAYQKNVLDAGVQTADLFGTNSKQAAAERDTAEIDTVTKLLNDRIIGELLAQTLVAIYDGIRFYEKKAGHGPQQRRPSDPGRGHARPGIYPPAADWQPDETRYRRGRQRYGSVALQEVAG